MGRTVLITGEDLVPKLDNTSVTITGEVQSISERFIMLSTTYEMLPSSGLLRLDLGPNMSTYQRIDRVLDLLQRCDPPSKKLKNRMGIMSPCTALGDALFADVDETSAA